VKLALQPLVPTCPPFACPDKSSSSLFTSALFSESYELPFPPARQSLGGQALCFDNHLNCPGVSPLWSPCSDLRALCVALFPVASFSTSLHPVFSIACSLLGALGSLFRASVLCFQQLPASFCKIPGVGGIPAFSANLRALCASALSLCFRSFLIYGFGLSRSTDLPLTPPISFDLQLSTVDFPSTMLKSTRTAYDHS